ncbi:hypothetical protein HHI36_000551 [Cryptolaemus montrouzieri]|uniref:Uncharacterized protein n=1 Tax=Cryptolaemus montrouzieri TaxID=559131 RepID=A0ABD2P594_9CUCU
MNFVLFLGVSCIIVGLSDIANAECQCFEEFHVEIENGQELCRGDKNHRIFSCGEEKPPICQCRRNGTIEELDIGETSCTSTVKTFDGIFCEPKDAWDKYFEKHAIRRIVY